MKSAFYMVYAAAGYVVGMLCVLYFVGFLAGAGVPKSIYDGDSTSIGLAVLIDMALVLLFGLHHSVTARSSFKRWWTKIVPEPIERATYLFMTAGVTYVLVAFWQPIPVTIWSLDNQIAQYCMYVAYALAWTMMVAATFHFGHFSFFGLAQAWNNVRRNPPRREQLSARYLYALVRHPISLGWMVTPWLTPHLTVGHIVFAAAATLYIVIATHFEEADLIDELGESYESYRERVPAFIPGLK